MNASLSPSSGIAAWKNEYRSIYDEFMKSIAAKGVVFAERNGSLGEITRLKQELAASGAKLMNGSASVSLNGLSPACRDCATCLTGRTFMLSGQCHRSCYFCFNPNQEGISAEGEMKDSWRSEMERYRSVGVKLSHIALTGGEPTLFPAETVEFFQTARTLFPRAYTRLYTSGDLLTEELLHQLAAAGLDEIRFSIKLDDAASMRSTVLGNISLAKQFFGAVGVEMPVEPGNYENICTLLRELELRDIDFINLLELCYPFHNWEAFASRGMRIKNPPFEVLYNYSYAGGLPVDGSELDALRLLKFALDQHMEFGIHYCSLANKHREQVYAANAMMAKGLPEYDFSSDDFFLRTVKVYGEAAEDAAHLLDSLGVSHSYGDGERLLRCHPRYRSVLSSHGIENAVSVCILEKRNGSQVLRELMLE